MGNPENPYKVRLDVSNFGPIAEGSVELRPLTVFIGPSNTGKTYLATLIYALHRFFKGAALLSALGPSSSLEPDSVRLRYGDPLDEVEFTKHEINLMSNWVKQVEVVPDILNGTQALPEEVAPIVRRQLQPNEAWNELLPGELARCFGIKNANRLIRYGSECSAKVSVASLENSGEDATSALKFDFDIENGSSKSSCAVSGDIPLRIANKFVHPQSKGFGLLRYLLSRGQVEMNPGLIGAISEEVAARVAETMVSPLSRPAHYLPTDRTGTMHAHRAMVTSVVASAPMIGLRDEVSLPKVSGVLSDFLIQMLSMENGDAQRESVLSEDLGKSVEKHVLSGNIHTDRSNPFYPAFFYLPDGWDKPLPLMNASSMVSELAPVVLFLRHVVKPGEVLIIEEPESNLHPAMQVELMRQLAAVVNAGVRIMITTHSEWILDELANLVRLSELPPEKRTARLKNEPALDPRDVGVWLFEQGESDEGSHVKELPFDLNEGGFATGYEDTARLTYNQWAAIHNLLQK